MTKNDSNSKPETPENADSLSATGMFLRAFEGKPEGEQKPFEPAPTSKTTAGIDARRSDPPPVTGVLRQPPFSPGQGSVRGSAAEAAPGEFTQLFQSLDKPAGPNSANQPPHSSPPIAATDAGATAVLRAPSQPPAAADTGPGEFTRIFVGGLTPPAPPPGGVPRSTQAEPPRAASAAAPNPAAATTAAANSIPASAAPAASGRAKGFSSPGVSDAASAEGSFTQFFKAPSPPQTPAAPPAARPAQPVFASTPPPRSSAPPSPPPAPEMPWRNDPGFAEPGKKTASESPAPSITSMMNSLASDGGASRTPEPAPYRPDPLPHAAPPPRPSQSGGADPGGVTRLIRSLSQEPAAPVAPAPPAAPPPPMNSGPGEYTRMIATPSAAPAEPAPPAPPAAAAPAFAKPPLPAAPPPPPMPKAPKAPAPPAFAAPPPPKAPAPPALAAPKTKLEAMVPILLVINTFLLLVLLVVVIVLIKAR